MMIPPLLCGVINPRYFEGYNTSSPTVTNYNGRTIPLMAIANVTPGVAYHLNWFCQITKMVGWIQQFFCRADPLTSGSILLTILPKIIDICNNPQQTDFKSADDSSWYDFSMV
ncbi:hypothetical protein MTQ00_22005 [Chryseobacterium sp. B21-037]|uniref:hypothetical protein n=1 Tax=Chryseobacterium sp. B21-037 TaxID=2926038 RepID=UPI0023582E9A|nr:hypothetical protein [Chryseobacterium sp. B21-037]MDC8107164.1 hypothetical protein [Chryseobacterium sp. B21-037]